MSIMERRSRSTISERDFLIQDGIRTHETRKGLLQFQGSAFNHSATCPHEVEEQQGLPVGGKLSIETEWSILFQRHLTELELV